MTSRLASGCRSSVVPCAHQRRSPDSLCHTCSEALWDDYVEPLPTAAQPDVLGPSQWSKPVVREITFNTTTYVEG